MKNTLKYFLLTSILLLLLPSCSTQKELYNIQKRLDNLTNTLASKQDFSQLSYRFSVLDSTIKSTQINILQYEINQKRSTYDTLGVDGTLQRTKKVLERLRLRKSPP